MKYKKIAFSSHMVSNAIIYKRRIKPLLDEARKYNIEIVNFHEDKEKIDVLIIQKLPESVKELKEILRNNSFLIYDNPNYLGKILNKNFPQKTYNFFKRILLTIIRRKWHPYILLEKLVEKADLITTGSKKQAEFFEKGFSKKTFNIVDPINNIEFSGKKKEHKDTEEIKILWEGTESSFLQLEDILPPLINLSKKYQFELILFTDIIEEKSIELFSKFKNNLNVKHIIWDKNKIDEVILSVDIAIAPIDVKDVFNYSKPFNKLLIYWGYGLPIVCSDIPSYSFATQAGDKGFSCNSSLEWEKSLTKLIKSTELRKKLGENGYNFSWNEYSQERYAERFFNKINEFYKDK
ncbi:glycosyltransferase family protein [Seonamhaeicola marinus]|uniref:Glycosyltransferase family 4 protein n=1 Tax=Seonamhaeicola marinus TaxID=1912246 RepID=A0A5D0HT32_9FLAO|nr:glycosyltransferase family 4 protein [Seonamhaeicola marinus]TYA74130.1 glycosyltransferase family 4 protein [Seonamhaeicola marinus]